MEIAIRAAMDKVNNNKKESKKKASKPSPVEQEELLSRTLDQKAN